jgi:hypothetical protein
MGFAHGERLHAFTAAVFVSLLVSVGAAWGAITTTPNIPDFYQHQYWEKLPAGVAGNEAGGGYCWPASAVEALYYWKVQPEYGALFHNDIATTAKWGPAARDAIDSFINDGKWDINKYVAAKGFEPAKLLEGKPTLLSTNYRVNAANGNVSVQTTSGREIVKKNGVNVEAFDLYIDQTKRGRSSVVTVKVPNQTKNYNNLWWWGSFHAMAGAGYDEAASILQVADPDSTKGNQTSNGGWYDLKANGSWDKSVAGIATAVARVNGNLYTAGDLGADVPLPGNMHGAGAAYTNTDLYARFEINADGYTIGKSDDTQLGVPGIYATGRFTGTKIAELDTIAPTLGALEPLIRLGVDKIRAAIRLVGDLSSSINNIMIFPTKRMNIAEAELDFDLPGWTASLTYEDPFEYPRTRGGIMLEADPGQYLLPDDIGLAEFNVMSRFERFDMFFHDELTDTWIVQSIGAAPSVRQHQTEIPEPVTFVAVLWVITLAAWTRRKR